jgi:mannosyltransferase
MTAPSAGHPRAQLWAALLAAALFALVRLPELTRSSLWFDELFSLGLAWLPFGASLARTVADHTNPPLFYLLLKAWIALGGDADAWVRLLPCLLSILGGPALLWLAREAGAGRVATLLAVGFAAASPLAVDMANEVRAYSLLTLLACLSLAATLRDRRTATRGSFALLTLVNVALVHTHYFGWFTVAAEVAAAILYWPRPALRRVLGSAALTALGFVPWAGAVLAHALTHAAPLRTVAWIARPTVGDLPWLIRDLTGGTSAGWPDVVWLVVACLALAALALPWVRRTAPARAAPDTPVLVLLALSGLAAPVLVWAVSTWAGRSIWVPRYLIGSAAPVALLVGTALAALAPRAPLSALAGVAWIALSLVALPFRPPTKFDWSGFAARLEAAGGPREVVAFEAFTAAPLERYAGGRLSVHVVHGVGEVPPGEWWVVFRPESFAARSPEPQLRAMGFDVERAEGQETAGQRIGALLVRK